MSENSNAIVFRSKDDTTPIKIRKTLFVVDGLDHFSKRDRDYALKHLELFYNIIHENGLSARIEIFQK